MKSILILLITFFSFSSANAFMPPHLKIGKTEWKQWTHQERKDFVSRQKDESGEMNRMAPVTAKKKLVFKDEDVADLIAGIDVLYDSEDNQYMTIYGALAIAVMKLNKCTEENISEKLRIEQTRIAWGF